MNSSRTTGFIALFFALVFALATGVTTYIYFNGLETELAEAKTAEQRLGDLVHVPVATRAIARGSTLMAEDFRKHPLPKAMVPSNVLTELPQATNGQIMVALGDLTPGAILIDSTIGLGPEGGGSGIFLAQDQRAFSVSAANLSEYQPMLFEGGAVDLFWTDQVGEISGDTRLVGNALRIIALPQATNPEMPSDPLQGQILVAGSAEEAARVLQIGHRGVLSILPAGGPIPPGTREIAIGPQELAELPLATRASMSNQDAVSLTLPISGADSDPKCQAVLVLGGQRTAMEVPC